MTGRALLGGGHFRQMLPHYLNIVKRCKKKKCMKVNLIVLYPGIPAMHGSTARSLWSPMVTLPVKLHRTSIRTLFSPFQALHWTHHGSQPHTTDSFHAGAFFRSPTRSVLIQTRSYCGRYLFPLRSCPPLLIASDHRSLIGLLPRSGSNQDQHTGRN